MLSLQIDSLFPKLHTVTTVRSLKIEVITTNLPHCKLCFEGSFEFVVPCNSWPARDSRHISHDGLPGGGGNSHVSVSRSRRVLCSPIEQLYSLLWVFTVYPTTAPVDLLTGRWFSSRSHDDPPPPRQRSCVFIIIVALFYSTAHDMKQGSSTAHDPRAKFMDFLRLPCI